MQRFPLTLSRATTATA